MAAGTTPGPPRTSLEVRQNYEKEDAMRTKLTYVAPVLGAAAVTAALLASPIASAATGTQAPAPQQQSCAASGSATVCQSPGNVQVNDAPPPAQFYPYGGLGFLL